MVVFESLFGCYNRAYCCLTRFNVTCCPLLHLMPLDRISGPYQRFCHKVELSPAFKLLFLVPGVLICAVESGQYSVCSWLVYFGALLVSDVFSRVLFICCKWCRVSSSCAHPIIHMCVMSVIQPGSYFSHPVWIEEFGWCPNWQKTIVSRDNL